MWIQFLSVRPTSHNIVTLSILFSYFFKSGILNPIVLGSSYPAMEPELGVAGETAAA
jgi:hypothetical protein